MVRMSRLSTRAIVGSLVALCVAQAGCGNQDGARPPAADTTPPAAVTNLSATALAPDSARLTWSAPGDDGGAGAAARYEVRRSVALLTETGWTAPGDDGDSGAAAEYDIRYAGAEITVENWASATPTSGIPAPQAAALREQLLVSGLQRKTTYDFALKTRDDVPGQWSSLSNSPRGTTTGTLALDEMLLVVDPGARFRIGPPGRDGDVLPIHG
jgi:hypothetical protein